MNASLGRLSSLWAAETPFARAICGARGNPCDSTLDCPPKMRGMHKYVNFVNSSLLLKISYRQDEGGLRPAGSSALLSSLAETTKSIAIRRAAAVASGGSTAGNDDATQREDRAESGARGICAAVTALQDCLVGARRAVLAVTGAALRVRISVFRQGPSLTLHKLVCV